MAFQRAHHRRGFGGLLDFLEDAVAAHRVAMNRILETLDEGLQMRNAIRERLESSPLIRFTGGDLGDLGLRRDSSALLDDAVEQPREAGGATDWITTRHRGRPPLAQYFLGPSRMNVSVAIPVLES